MLGFSLQSNQSGRPILSFGKRSRLQKTVAEEKMVWVAGYCVYCAVYKILCMLYSSQLLVSCVALRCSNWHILHCSVYNILCCAVHSKAYNSVGMDKV